MLLAVFGDLHFGAGVGLGKLDTETHTHTRLLDYIQTTKNNIDYIVKQGVKLLIFVGDIFEHRNTTNVQQKAFANCIQYGLDKGLEIIIIKGNHDEQRSSSSSTIDVYKEINIDRVHVYTEFGTFKYGDTTIFLMPFKDRKHYSVYTNDEALLKVKGELDALGFSTTKNKIVVAHFMFQGSLQHSDIYDVSLSEIYLSNDMFIGTDITIFGHIHRGGLFSKDPLIIGTGSNERNNFGERDYDKGLVIVDTDDFEKSKFHPRPVRNLYEIKLDYTDHKLEKGETAKKILEDIDKFATKHDIRDSIIRLIAKVEQSEIYTISQNTIKNYLYEKGVNYCSGVSVSSFMAAVEKSKISELTDPKKILEHYVGGLKENEKMKKSMVEFATKIINDVEGGASDTNKFKNK